MLPLSVKTKVQVLYDPTIWQNCLGCLGWWMLECMGEINRCLLLVSEPLFQQELPSARPTDVCVPQSALHTSENLLCSDIVNKSHINVLKTSSREKKSQPTN